MSTEVKVPALGESITSGILVTWLVKEGDYVNKGDLLYELETDKITSKPLPKSLAQSRFLPKRVTRSI